MLRTFFHAWERKLAYNDDGERRVLPFEWGAEYLPSFADWTNPNLAKSPTVEPTVNPTVKLKFPGQKAKNLNKIKQIAQN